MKEIKVTKPSECPFVSIGQFELAADCNLSNEICVEILEGDNNFPPDCPLFENDYIVKRRNNDNTANSQKTKEGGTIF